MNPTFRIAVENILDLLQSRLLLSLLLSLDERRIRITKSIRRCGGRRLALAFGRNYIFIDVVAIHPAVMKRHGMLLLVSGLHETPGLTLYGGLELLSQGGVDRRRDGDAAQRGGEAEREHFGSSGRVAHLLAELRGIVGLGIPSSPDAAVELEVELDVGVSVGVEEGLLLLLLHAMSKRCQGVEPLLPVMVEDEAEVLELGARIHGLPNVAQVAEALLDVDFKAGDELTVNGAQTSQEVAHVGGVDDIDDVVGE